MKRPNYRRRWHGVYIHPLIKLLFLLLLAAGTFVLTQNARRSGETPGGNGTTEPVQSVQPPDKLPEHMITASGVRCTLTQLPEDTVYTGDLVLVNNWTPFHFPENQADVLECILDKRTDSYLVRDGTVYLLPQAMSALNDMMDAFRAQGGKKTVQIIAGHRTTEYQQHLFDQSTERNGLEHAKRYVAQPGYSEHHTGLVVDMGTKSGEFMESSDDYVWITEHCQEYGWIVRYETGKEDRTGIWDEPWHFRYVGIPHAVEIVRCGYCLEEYIDYLKDFPQDGEHLLIDCAAGQFEVWYAQGTEVYLPDSNAYQISGNNVDGVIVTCQIR